MFSTRDSTASWAGPPRIVALHSSFFFQLPNLCSPGLAASLPRSHTRVRATWAYPCLGRATRARAPTAPPAPSAHIPLNTCQHRQLPYAIACTLAPPARRRSRSCRSSTCTDSSAHELLHRRNHAAPAPVLARRQFACVAPHQLMPEPFAPTQLRSSLVRSAPAHPFLLCRPAPALSLAPQLLHSAGAHAPAPANSERQNRAAPPRQRPQPHATSAVPRSPRVRTQRCSFPLCRGPRLRSPLPGRTPLGPDHALPFSCALAAPASPTSRVRLAPGPSCRPGLAPAMRARQHPAWARQPPRLRLAAAAAHRPSRRCELQPPACSLASAPPSAAPPLRPRVAPMPGPRSRPARAPAPAPAAERRPTRAAPL
jgi:hypothetical protein